MKRPAKLPVNSDWRVSRLVFCVVLPSPFAYMQRGVGANNNNICVGINITICAMIVPFVHKVRLSPNLASCAVLRRSDANKMNVHYVIPSKRVARLGAAICGRGNSLRNFNSTCSIVSLEPKRGVVHLGLLFDCAARRCARFGLVFCIVFPFAVVAVLPVIEPRCAALLQAILSVGFAPLCGRCDLATNQIARLLILPKCWD